MRNEAIKFEAIPGHLDERNRIIRQIRRRLRKEGRTILNLRGADGARRLYVVDLHPAHAVKDAEGLADQIGLHKCHFCGVRRRSVSAYKDVFICTNERCMFECIARELNGR